VAIDRGCVGFSGGGDRGGGGGRLGAAHAPARARTRARARAAPPTRFCSFNGLASTTDRLPFFFLLEVPLASPQPAVGDHVRWHVHILKKMVVKSVGRFLPGFFWPLFFFLGRPRVHLRQLAKSSCERKRCQFFVLSWSLFPVKARKMSHKKYRTMFFLCFFSSVPCRSCVQRELVGLVVAVATR
jgi:hypothetical protein